MAKNKSNVLRNIIIGAVILIVLIIIAKKAGWIGGEDVTEVETAKVGRHTITETVNASGNLQPETEVKISADISGQIIELPVNEGQKVKKGDLLVKIRPDEYQRGVERAQAASNNARANLANAKAGYAQAKAQFERSKLLFERNQKLFDQKAISQSDFENIKAEFEVAKAQLEGAAQTIKAAEYTLASANASLKEAQFSLSKTSIFSPMDGTISKLNVELGERVVGTMQMAGTEMMRVANLSVMEVEVDVNENDIVRLTKGDTADIEVEAFRAEKFKGIVTEIANSSATTNDQISAEKVTNFKVKIRLLEDSYKHLLKQNSTVTTPFRPGMTANAEIHTNKIENTLAVPILAVTVRSEKENQDTTKTTKSSDEKEVVFLYKNGKAEQKIVKTGIQDDNNIQIIEGLEEGQEVISGPYRVVSKLLKDGELIKKSEGKKEKENEKSED